MSAKEKFLAVHDYGMGGAWLFIYVRSVEEITDRYPELEVVPEYPSWLNGELLRNIEKNLTYDIDDRPTGVLAEIIKERIQSIGD